MPKDSQRVSSTAAVLDHVFYPHILDAIVACAPPESLAALRAASRGWKARVDPLLYAHVVMRSAPGNRGQVHAPAYPFPVLRVLQGWRDEPPLLLEHTRVLDLCASYLYGRPGAFPSLSVIRHALEHRTWPMPRFASSTSYSETRCYHSTTGRSCGRKDMVDSLCRLQKHSGHEPCPCCCADIFSSSHATAYDPPSPQDTSEPRTYLPPSRWRPITHGVYIAYLHLTQPRWHEDGIPGLYIDPPERTQRLVLHLTWDPLYPRVNRADVSFGEIGLHGDVVVVLHPLRETSSHRESARSGSGALGSTKRKRNADEGGRAQQRRRTSGHDPASQSLTLETTSLETSTALSSTPGLLGNLAYSLMNSVLRHGVRVTFVGTERCSSSDLSIPPSPSQHGTQDRQRSESPPVDVPRQDTASTAKQFLHSLFDSFLILPTEFEWDYERAWPEMWPGLDPTNITDGLTRHFDFVAKDEWRSQAPWYERESIEWETHPAAQVRTFSTRP